MSARTIIEATMTLAQARQQLASLGCVLRHDAASGEYHVRLRNSSMDSGYFATDLQDAVDTGRQMADEASRKVR